MSRVLVTGANGLIGSRLVARLSAGGHEVIAVGRMAQRVNAGAPGVHYAELNLIVPGKLHALILEARPEAVLHAAAMTDVDECERAPALAWRLNVGAVEEAAMGATAVGARLVAISTDYVFDGEAGPYAESDLPNPRGAYAKSKRAGEDAALVLAKGAAVARVAVVYSGLPGAKRTFAVATREALEQGKEVRAFEDQLVSPTLADNAAEMILGLWQRGEPGLWHCAGASVVSRVEFCRALARKLGRDEAQVVPTRVAEVKLLAPRPLRVGLRVEKIQRLLGERVPLALDEQLQRFIEGSG